MHILVITPYFHPHTGGSQRYIEELYSELLNQNPGWQVDILTYNTDKAAKREKYLGMTIYRVGCLEILPGQFALPNYLELVKTLRALKKQRYTLVNSHTRFFDNSWWAPMAARYLNAIPVLTDHCAYHPSHPLVLVRLLTKALDHLVIPLLGKVYPHVTAVSHATSKFLSSHGLNKNPQVIYGGINPGNYQTHAQNRTIPGLGKVSPQDIIVTFAGRLIPAKGPELLAETAISLQKNHPQFRFIFAGDGGMLAQLKSRYQHPRLHFVGQLNRSQMTKLLLDTDVLTLPSTHHEGLPSILLEVGAAGCAVITTDRGGVKELVESGKSGLIINPTHQSLNNALIKLNDKKLRLNLGQNLQKKVYASFDWQLIAKKYRDFLLGLSAN